MAKLKKIIIGIKNFPFKSSEFDEKQVIGSKNTPVKSVTTMNSKKKNAAVNSFHLIHFNGYRILRQVIIENLSIKISLNSSSF